VIYAIYDGRSNWWNCSQTSATLPGAPQITNATVSWTDDGVAKKCGYDYTATTWETSWVIGSETKVMAYFAFWPSPAKIGEWVYFTDLSIAANNWYYSQGDGGTTGARSFYHKYAKSGEFAVMQNVTGPAGSDAVTRNVPVKAPATTGALMLLLD
jgi:hypothetical protein